MCLSTFFLHALSHGGKIILGIKGYKWYLTSLCNTAHSETKLMTTSVLIIPILAFWFQLVFKLYEEGKFTSKTKWNLTPKCGSGLNVHQNCSHQLSQLCYMFMFLIPSTIMLLTSWAMNSDTAIPNSMEQDADLLSPYADVPWLRWQLLPKIMIFMFDA